ncbi:transcriptional regulator [Lapidilactobacillus concavus DSM 17758]|uniref:Transcriptional regulator n=1 Tax=Lapidilactobacillus concavus DSM 17758 TaxID=1423735 RepID=A0A0R1W475_9LACO|nr:MurR/RpiR family transcriptional regulator [Lapidilactobacillus concavus]KRM12442.1 transcriptional regulator [Lapidilactobacillus concavus DSM 17758]GEL13275.1 transcriptional regulator [Lapidilactobacillus concavus]
MSVRGRILNAKGDLSEAEAKVADYILKHQQQVLKMTIKQLAKASNSSPASVIRLTKRLDIDSFTTLRILLSSDLTKNHSDPKDNADITKNEQLSSIKEKLLSSALQSIRETTDQVNEDEVDHLVSAIIHSQRLFIFGIGASYLAVENISQKWNRIGYPTVADNDLNALLPKVINAGKNDVLWIISNSGESPEVLLAAQTAKEKGVKVASLTRFGNNSLAKLSDISVHTSQPMESPNRIAATNSLLAQFMLIDIIFYFFVSKSFDKSAKALDASHRVVRDYKQSLLK